MTYDDLDGPEPRTPLERALNDVGRVPVWAELMIDDALKDDGTFEAAVRLVMTVDECRRGLAVLRDTVERAAIERAGEKKIVVAGLGEVEVKKSARRTGWRWDELAPRLMSLISDEPGIYFDESGEQFPAHMIGQRLWLRVRDVVSFSSPKLTGLRALGLDPDEWCTVDEAHYSLKLPRA